MLLKKYICLSAATLLTACDLIDYHPYDGRLDSDTSREINPTNIERIEKVCEGKDTIRFIFMGDTQRSYNETEDFVKYVNQLDSIDFIIHGGDYTEFGLKKEFEWNDDILSKLKVPYVGLIGNHDVIGNGDQVFRKIFGNENFSFVVSDVKFVCLNTNAIEYDYSHPVPDFNFLKNEIADSTRNKRTIVVMHAPPGNEQFDNIPLTLHAQEDKYTKRVQRYENAWQRVIPRYTKVQFAGSMAMLSVGTGWNYYRNHWETDMLLGIVPRNANDHANVTFTLKQNYFPWNIDLGEKVSFEPLCCGIYVNFLFDRDFWAKQPNKYPPGYYWFSTRIRNHIFIGERITLKLNPNSSWHKSISFFYELSTCDLYIINAIGNSYLKPKDYLSLSFGVKLQIL
ncbi:metallophosphoesterase [Parabacteroides sp. Y3-G-102]|uniref:metallophosphoesterase family protein n=3 Tax=Parabacteroides distasonis TaxID=823 RepID=UPI00202ECC5E|nr:MULTISPECIES: metallophosphoesterase [Parabacteroides]MCM0726647.1 metallophosphoesterase [Parabacteroides sp. Y3-G-102]